MDEQTTSPALLSSSESHIMNKQLIVFLDLDGVFKTSRSALAGLPYDPVASTLIDKLCATPNTLAVISATCRAHHDTREEAQQWWRSLGMPNLVLHEDWRTADFHGHRVLEIQDWFLRNPVKPDQEFLFVDDEMPIFTQGLNHDLHELFRVNWLLIGGHHNGMSYLQCRALRGLINERKSLNQETEDTEEEGAATGISQTGQAEKAVGENLCSEVSLTGSGGTELCSIVPPEERSDSEESSRLRIPLEKFKFKTNPKSIGALVTYQTDDGRIVSAREIKERSIRS